MALNASAAGSSSSGSKRVRLAELQGNADSTQSSQFQPRASQRAANDYYDPDQDVAERRKIRKGLRDLQREMNGIFARRSIVMNKVLTKEKRLQRGISPER